MSKKIASGYVRVSTGPQGEKDKTSPEDQRRYIKEYIARQKDWTLGQIYGEAASGGSMEDRLEMQKLLTDAMLGKFQVVVCDKWDRFGRDFDDQRHNIKLLIDAGCDIISVTEPGDVKTYIGKFAANIFGSIAELEKYRIKERMLGGRVSNLKKGQPSVGNLPYGRYYERKMEGGRFIRDYDLGMQLDPEKREKIKIAAREYLNGKSLTVIGEEIGLHPRRLTNILRDQCSSKWTITYKPQKEIPKLAEGASVTLDIPRLLDDLTIRKIKDRLKKNLKFDWKKQVTEFPLSGFLKCAKCGKAYTGASAQKAKYLYYRHPVEYNDQNCPIHYLNAARMEDLVFKVIFENTHDQAGFRKAIDSLPDAKHIKELQGGLEKAEKEMEKQKRTYKQFIEKIVAGMIVADGTIKEVQAEMRSGIEKIEEMVRERQHQLASLPKLDIAERQAERVRLGLMDYFGSLKRLKTMTYREKKALLANLFHGESKEEKAGDIIMLPGKKRGIYIKKDQDGSIHIELLADIFWGEQILEKNVSTFSEQTR